MFLLTSGHALTSNQQCSDVIDLVHQLAYCTGQMNDSTPAAPPPAASGNRTGKSLFVLEALLATFTKDSAASNTGTLLLQSVSPKTTWFSGEATLKQRPLICDKVFKKQDADRDLKERNPITRIILHFHEQADQTRQW